VIPVIAEEKKPGFLQPGFFVRIVYKECAHGQKTLTGDEGKTTI